MKEIRQRLTISYLLTDLIPIMAGREERNITLFLTHMSLILWRWQEPPYQRIRPVPGGCWLPLQLRQPRSTVTYPPAGWHGVYHCGDFSASSTSAAFLGYAVQPVHGASR